MVAFPVRLPEVDGEVTQVVDLMPGGLQRSHQTGLAKSARRMLDADTVGSCAAGVAEDVDGHHPSRMPHQRAGTAPTVG